jgi:hypothetical protein
MTLSAAKRKIEIQSAAHAIAGRQKATKASQKAGRHRRMRVLQLLVLAGLLVTLGLVCFSLKFWILDLDLWVHLRVGNWIIQHHALPHTGLFSRTAADRPWIAYSWGYEVLLSGVYAWLGIMGVAIFQTLMVLAVAYAIYWMAHRLSGHFWLSCLLATAACSGFLIPVYALRCCTMVLFTMTLTLILEANRSGRVQLLYWLPLILLVWANLHIQFVYGIAVIGLFVAVNLLQRLANSLGFTPRFLLPPTLPILPLGAILAACLLATCIGPYSFHLYQVVYTYSKAKAAYTLVSELLPPDFSRYSHYVQLLLPAAAFASLGWRKQIDLFKLLLLAVATVVAFRTVRDAWFVCITAAACIADSQVPGASRDPEETLAERLVMAAVVAAALWLFAPSMDFDPSGIDRALIRQLPVNAVKFLRQNPHPGPLYNTFDWGSFLIWSMPDYPVAIDGRTDLYGDELDERFAFTARGVSYQDDPYLNESRLIVLQQKNILVKFLTADPRLELIYQDGVAVVFARR